MIAGVGSCDVGILAAFLPVKLTGFHYDTAKSGSMAADELGRGMYHDICAMLDGSEQIRSSESIIYYQGKPVLMSYLCDSVYIGDITVGISKSLQIDRSGVFLYSALNLCQVVCIHESSVDAVLGKGVSQQVVAAAVDGLLCYDVAAVCCKRLNGICDRCRSGSKRQCCAAAFKCSQSLLKYILG